MSVARLPIAAICLLASTLAHAQSSPSPAGIGVALDHGPDAGVLIRGVKPASPADRAGLRAGDLILAVDGAPARTLGGPNDLPRVIGGPAGSDVTLTILTPGEPRPRDVRLTREAGIPVRAGTLPPPYPTMQPSPTTTPVVREREIARVDPTPFGAFAIRDPVVSDVVSFVARVPDGWRARGEVAWTPALASLAELRLEVWDPRTGASVRWLPGERFVFAPDATSAPGGPPPLGVVGGRRWLAPPDGPAGFVQAYLVGADVTPELRGLAPVEEETFPIQSAQTLAMMNAGPGATARSVRLRYRVERDGGPWDVDVYFTLGTMPAAADGATDWFCAHAQAVAAPAGEIERTPALRVVRGSAEPTAEWLAGRQLAGEAMSRRGTGDAQDAVAWLTRELAAQRGRQRSAALEIDAARARTVDDRSRAIGESLGGVDRWRDPIAGRDVLLPRGFAAAWANRRGDLLLAERARLDPDVDGDARWEPLTRVGPSTRKESATSDENGGVRDSR